MVQNTQDNLEHLLAQTSLGNHSAFKELYDLCSAKLNGVAYRIVRDVDTANEITQEAFIQIWKNASQYKSSFAQPMTWMTSIVRYRAYDRVRSDKNRMDWKHSEYDSAELDNIEAQGSGIPGILNIDKQLNICFNILSSEQRESIMMAYYYGFSREEISERFKRPINSVKSMLRRGLMRLQECLNQ